jgi:hypothetical protein
MKKATTVCLCATAAFVLETARHATVVASHTVMYNAILFPQDPDSHDTVLSERGQRIVDMNASIAKHIMKNIEFMIEVDSPARHLFLRAGYKGALDRWMTALQILADLPVTAVWPEEFGACCLFCIS